MCTPAFQFRSEKRNVKEAENVTNNDDETIVDLIADTLNYTLSEYQENIIYYIAGFIVRKLLKSLDCMYCLDILLNKPAQNEDHIYSVEPALYNKFTNFVSSGGLLHPSTIVFNIVAFTEKQFRVLHDKKGIQTLHLKKLIEKSVIQHFCEKMHLFVPHHPIVEEQIFEDLHEIQLMRQIANLYFKCRINAHLKSINQKVGGRKLGIRQKFTKLILFHESKQLSK